MNGSPGDISELLNAIANGDESASEALFPLVYDELHGLASKYMSRERANHTLQPTALIHEAFLKLTKSEHAANSDTVASSSGQFEDLNHFVATAAVVMRRILVNHAKAKKAEKRGGGKANIQLDDVAEAFQQSAIDLVALDEAMEQLKEIDAVQHQIVELRFFGGLTTEQCAKLLGISERTAYYEWAHARAWLKSQMESH